MQAIRTRAARYMPSRKGFGIIASCAAKRIIVMRDDELTDEQNARRALDTLVSKLDCSFSGFRWTAGAYAGDTYWTASRDVWAFSARRAVSGSNTYHTVSISRNGAHVWTSPKTYGYGDHFQKTAIDYLKDQNLIPQDTRADSLCASWDVADVARQSDL